MLKLFVKNKDVTLLKPTKTRAQMMFFISVFCTHKWKYGVRKRRDTNFCTSESLHEATGGRFFFTLLIREVERKRTFCISRYCVLRKYNVLRTWTIVNQWNTHLSNHWTGTADYWTHLIFKTNTSYFTGSSQLNKRISFFVVFVTPFGNIHSHGCIQTNSLFWIAFNYIKSQMEGVACWKPRPACSQRD